MKSASPIAANSISLRPQPLGIFGGVTAHLLLPPIADLAELEFAQSALEALMHGNSSARIPTDWTFFHCALRGDIEGTRAELDALLERAPSLDAILVYNQFVLAPSAQSYQQLQTQLQGEMLMLLDTAAYASGIAEHPPQFDSRIEPILSGELAAWVLATIAASDLEQQDFQSARSKLGVAIEYAKPSSPLLAAMLTAQAASLAQQRLDIAPAILKREYESAIQLAEGCLLPGFLAELWTQVGMLIQTSFAGSREGLLESIKAYQQAIQCGVDPNTNPQLFAELQNNLGAAYVAMSNSESSNQLRMGIAIQSFRRALDALDPETDSELVARINMNLASALQYAPSSHPAENLIQAVEIYEQVLAYRTKARDPVAYALVLLNQANALAHLGMFKPSLEKASEAHKLFQWYEQAEPAATARELVEQVNGELERCNEKARHGSA